MARTEMSRRDFVKWAGLLALRGTIVGAGGFGYVTALEPNWVGVEQVKLKLPRLAPEFNGYRVVQISDIHMGDWTDSDHLGDVVRQVNAQNPDLIAVTGDFITNNPRAQRVALVSNLTNLRAKDGVVGILGNHDWWHGPQTVRDYINQSGMIDLSNRVHTIMRGSAQFHIGGVDDVWNEANRLDLVLDALPKSGAAMLLAHEPDFADTSAESGRFDLQISGHSHGGQVVIPLIGPIQLPELGQKYPLGRYQVGDMIQYTNRGIGMVRPHVRMNCRPEITVFTLNAGAA